MMFGVSLSVPALSALLLCTAGVTIFGRFDDEAIKYTNRISVYLSPNPRFTEPSAVVCLPDNFTASTSLVPMTFMCSSTISNARFVTIRRETDATNNYLQVNEILPLRYRKFECTRMLCLHRLVHPNTVSHSDSGIPRISV